MKTNEKQRCHKCNYLRIGRLMYCPKCGNKYENEIPLKKHPATYKKCMDCKYFTKDTRWGWISSGYCECPHKKFRYEGPSANFYQRTKKACKHFEEKI